MYTVSRSAARPGSAALVHRLDDLGRAAGRRARRTARPGASSSAPGASPTNTMPLRAEPTPGTAFVRVWHRPHFVHARARPAISPGSAATPPRSPRAPRGRAGSAARGSAAARTGTRTSGAAARRTARPTPRPARSRRRRFGGSPPGIANLVPQDIVIRNNHLFKPLAGKQVTQALMAMIGASRTASNSRTPVAYWWREMSSRTTGSIRSGICHPHDCPR